jgi:hypothetical protein
MDMSQHLIIMGILLVGLSLFTQQPAQANHYFVRYVDNHYVTTDFFGNRVVVHSTQPVVVESRAHPTVVRVRTGPPYGNAYGYWGLRGKSGNRHHHQR